MEESKIDGIGKIPPNIFKQAERIITRQARVMQSYVRKEHLTGGTTDTRLRARTGKLRASCIPIKTEIKEGSVEGGISFGTVYGRVHVGPKGQVTTIVPKRSKYLTIPLPAAMTKAGVGKGSARLGPWTNTFVRKSKAGNLIMFGQMTSYSKVKVGGTAVKGLAIRKISSNVVPLFVLKKQVKVKARIHPEDLIAWIKPKMIEDFLKGGIEVG
jgi:hypothetical protein